MIYLKAYRLSKHCWSASINQNSDSADPTVTVLTASKVSFLPVMFEVSYNPASYSAEPVFKGYSAEHVFKVKFRFMRVQSPINGTFSWECIDTWVKPDAFSHEAICAALDEILKVEAYEVIEGSEHEKLHREDVERARDNRLVPSQV